MPAKGQKPQLFRPVYRAYDIGIEFNEDYVATMYAMDSRDLSLYLFNANNQPVRDGQGRLIAIDNLWDTADRKPINPGDTDDHSPPADPSDQTLLEQASACVSIDVEKITRPAEVTACNYLMEADTVYEARLMPLLFREDFSGGTLDRWQVIDQGGGGPSKWETGSEGDGSDNNPKSFFVRQTSAIADSAPDDSTQFRRGTMLIRRADPGIGDGHADHPQNWTDYRFQAQVRTSEDDFIGLVFRYRDLADEPEKYYLVTLGRGVRRLIRGIAGIHQILAEDTFLLALDTDYRLTIEAIGPTLTIYQDGDRVFTVDDLSLPQGSVGLYCAHNPTTQFSDLRVDDLRQTAPMLYRFAFTTSLYTNFYHHIHSYNDECWLLALEPGVSLLVNDAIALSQLQTPDPGWPSNSQPDVKAYENLIAASSVLRTADQRVVDRIEVSRLIQQGNPVGLFLSSPEPIDWRRTTLELFHAPTLLESSTPSDAVKLTEITHDPSDPSKELVALLLRKPYSLAEHRIEKYALIGPISPHPVRHLFKGKPDFNAAIVLLERFGPFALDKYRVVDQGSIFGPSQWQSGSNAITQSSQIFGGALDRRNLDKIGTMALVSAPTLRDIYIRVAFSSAGDGDIGLAFRVKDSQNYYRFSINRRWGYQRLVKAVDGQFTLLWEEAGQPIADKIYHLEILLRGDQLSGYLDSKELFHLSDRTHTTGQVGLYSWYNSNARFAALRIEDAREYNYFGASRRIGDWKITEERCQFLSVSRSRSSLALPGFHNPLGQLAVAFHKHALIGEPDWSDYRLNVSGMLSSDSKINLLFRYRDTSNYYQFEVGAEPNVLRLLRRSNGLTETLAEMPGGAPEEEPVSIRVDVVGDRLTAYVNEVLIFDIRDSTHASGRVGFAYRSDLEPQIESFTVTTVPLDGIALFCDRFAQENPDAWVDLQTHSEWEIHDSGTLESPSLWQIYQGSLWQRRNIHSAPPPTNQDPNKLGTHAIAGNLEWRDYVLSVRLCSDDKDAMGVVFRYQDEDNYYRFAMDTQRPYRQLVKRVNGQFQVLWEDAGIASPAYKPGQTYHLVMVVEGSSLRGYLDDIPLFIVADMALATGKIGLYTWLNDHACFSQVRVYPLTVLYQLHQRLIKELKEWQYDYPSISLVNTINPFDGPFSRSRYQDIEELSDWNDYRLSTQFASDIRINNINIYFQYVDENNFYCIQIDCKRKALTLGKKVNSQVEILQTHLLLGYQNIRKYILTIDYVEDRLSVYLDSVKLITQRDRSHNTGKVRLSYSWRSSLGINQLPPLVFTHFEAIRPAWVDYTQFPIEECPLPEGTRIVIHHPKSTELPENVGTVLRIADNLPPHLGDDIADLRLVDKAGNILDAKRSLPQTDFSAADDSSPISLKALRNADGTKLLLLPHDNTPLTSGTYRLKFTYRRDAGNQLPQFSQSGDQKDEESTIDVPWEPVI